jgi:hypothetical protein
VVREKRRLVTVNNQVGHDIENVRCFKLIFFAGGETRLGNGWPRGEDLVADVLKVPACGRGCFGEVA